MHSLRKRRSNDAAPITRILPETGEAEAIFRRAEATARGLDEVSRAIGASGGANAAAYELAEQYVAAFKVRCRTVLCLACSAEAWTLRSDTVQLILTGSSRPTALLRRPACLHYPCILAVSPRLLQP